MIGVASCTTANIVSKDSGVDGANGTGGASTGSGGRASGGSDGTGGAPMGSGGGGGAAGAAGNTGTGGAAGGATGGSGGGGSAGTTGTGGRGGSGTGGAAGGGGRGGNGTGGGATGGAVGTGGAGTGGAGTGGAGTGGAGTGGAGTGGAGTGGDGTGGAGTGGAGTGGSTTVATPTAAGHVVITEIMVDTKASPDDLGEWFEIYNPSTTVAYSLTGCTLADQGNGNTHVIAGALLVAPGGFVTLARTSDVTSMGFLPSYSYGMTLKFNNDGPDTVRISCGGVLIDQVDFPAMASGGQSRSLDPRHFSAVDNDNQANWCLGTALYHATATGNDNGSPGTGLHPQCATAAP